MSIAGKYLTLKNLTFVASAILFTVLIYYFFTGAGGQRYLAVRMVQKKCGVPYF